VKFLKKFTKKTSEPENQEGMENDKNSTEGTPGDPAEAIKAKLEGEDAGQAGEQAPVGEEVAAAPVLSEEQIQELFEQATQARREAEDYKDRYMRSLAEFENFKKRAMKERSDLLKYQGEKVFQDILENVDNLELALTYSSSDYEKMKTGLELIYKKLIDTLGRWEVRGQSSIGKDFDPNIHNAISRVMVDDARPGTIINELKKTYFYKDKLLRFGEVVVAEGRSEPVEPASASAGETKDN
jgi:molecular chaperone GrpE